MQYGQQPVQSSCLSYGTRALVAVFVCLAFGSVARAQDPKTQTDDSQKQTEPAKTQPSQAPDKVDVNPVARDDEIRKRLQSVLEATGWFADPQVDVEEGVVFLSGRTETDELKKWAGDLARSTQDVVAVVNRLEVAEPSVWDFEPAWNEASVLWRDIARSLPILGVGFLVLVLFFGISLLATKASRVLLQPRIRSRLLRRVIARAIGVFVFLIGIYIVLRLSGLTQLALTIIGGTGLIGLAFGIAFRDITENFLASVFLSIQRPFETGDLIEVEGITGYVQQLNVRTTIVMTLAGNLVQIPNATLYKSNLQNFTANDNRREDFVVGIGYDDAIHEAQQTAQQVLIDHPAVLDDPEPSVLVDSLGTATVNLRIYFWINGREHSWLKVRSSVIRLVKLAFQQNGISMPDEAREVVFPQGVPVTMTGDKTDTDKQSVPPQRTTTRLPADEIHAASTQAEGGFTSEAAVIEGQARQAKPLKEVANLLPDPGAGGSADPSEN